MTQPPLPLASPSKRTMCERVEAYLKARAGQWVDGRALATVGGYAAYRTRISDLRRVPYLMVIENRVRKVNGFTTSEYRYVHGSVGVDGDTPQVGIAGPITGGAAARLTGEAKAFGHPPSYTRPVATGSRVRTGTLPSETRSA